MPATCPHCDMDGEATDGGHRKICPAATPIDAPTEITTYHDAATDRFVRTALVIAAAGAKGGSFDLLTRDREGNVRRAVQINASFCLDEHGGETLIVDVIDVDRRFGKRRMLAFSREGASTLDMGQATIACVELSTKKRGKAPAKPRAKKSTKAK